MTLLCLQAGILCLFHLSPSFAAVLRATASHKRGPRAEWMPSRHRNPHKTVDKNNFRRYALVPTTIFTFENIPMSRAANGSFVVYRLPHDL